MGIKFSGNQGLKFIIYQQWKLFMNMAPAGKIWSSQKSSGKDLFLLVKFITDRLDII